MEVADGSLAVAEELEHTDADRMAEDPEQLGLDDVDGVRAHVDGAELGRRCGCGCAAARGHCLRRVDEEADQTGRSAAPACAMNLMGFEG